MNPICSLAAAQWRDPRLARQKGEPGAPGCFGRYAAALGVAQEPSPRRFIWKSRSEQLIMSANVTNEHSERDCTWLASLRVHHRKHGVRVFLIGAFTTHSTGASELSPTIEHW